MAYKNIEDSRLAIRRHYHLNKAKYLAKNRARREKIRQYLVELKQRSPCTDCGVVYPYYVMDYDHLEDKTMIISQLVNRGSMAALARELKKCEIVCANCHRIRNTNAQQYEMIQVRPRSSVD